jgi:hypothetical protein
MDNKVIVWGDVERILLVQSILKMLIFVNKTMNLPVQNSLEGFLE